DAANPVDGGARGIEASKAVVLASGNMRALRVTRSAKVLVPDWGIERHEERLGGAHRIEHSAVLRDSRGKRATDMVVSAHPDHGSLTQSGGAGSVLADDPNRSPCWHDR